LSKSETLVDKRNIAQSVTTIYVTPREFSLFSTKPT